MTEQGEDRIWRGAEAALRRLDELEAALIPIASFMNGLDAYAVFHRGRHHPDDKVLGYAQTEMNDCGALCVGHLRDAQDAVRGLEVGHWSGIYRRLRPRDSAAPSGDRP